MHRHYAAKLTVCPGDPGYLGSPADPGGPGFYTAPTIIDLTHYGKHF